MAHDLTDDEIDQICSFLRVIDLMKKHEAEVNSLPELKENVEKMSALVKEMMNQLTEEQQDEILEIHKLQAEAVAKEVERKLKRKKKK